MNRNVKDPFEEDEVWDLLGSASRHEPCGSFLDDTVRKARLEKPGAVRPWTFLLRPVAAGAAAVALAGTVFLLLNDGRAPAPVVVSGGAESALVALEEELSEELLLTAAENPSLFSDREVLAMLD